MATIKIKHTGSPIRRTKDQRATLVGLAFQLDAKPASSRSGDPVREVG